jgi:serine/threonine-protein kinase HipA
VGDLALVEGRLQFSYSADWLQQSDAVPLSCSLPFQVEVFNDLQARPFFAGLLPEGKLRQLIARQFQVSKQNDFALLDHIGGECAGAVSLLPPDGLLAVSNSASDIDWLSDDDLLAVLDELPQRPMLAGQDGLRL